ncbi:hypothetical protein CPB83DRAFT_899021 [Crepidotus variabilis]|uniref:Fungal-type protein kinase domain-containing protein n=1 Tax=Crepidotus variabilis TaxID=179855 RepID=A0A9P6E677_9AGAR|nr:hypothetical protein CPB83DRAFT_899021 [Crepidotus variabilis]
MALCGRCTVGLRASYNPDTEKLPGVKIDCFIKTSFLIEAKKTNKVELLRQAIGLKGVGQLLCAERGKESFQVFDDHMSGRWSLSKQCVDQWRYTCDIALKPYGCSIANIEDRLELLTTMLNAIRGHSNLFFGKRILHRDISANNILRGSNGAPPGMRGILIDLDSAVKFTQREDEKIDNGKVTNRTGTRVFQSTIALMIGTLKDPVVGGVPLHDHIDDLEAFFWVLYTLCHSVAEEDSPWDRWQTAPVLDVANHKTSILFTPLNTSVFQADGRLKQFGPRIGQLLEELRCFFSGHYLRKYSALHRPGPPPIADVIFAEAPKDYKKVLALFEQTITDTEREARDGSSAGLVQSSTADSSAQEADIEMDDEFGLSEVRNGGKQFASLPSRLSLVDNKERPPPVEVFELLTEVDAEPVPTVYEVPNNSDESAPPAAIPKANGNPPTDHDKLDDHASR